jgi:hypothetical protein
MIAALSMPCTVLSLVDCAIPAAEGDGSRRVPFWRLSDGQ